MSNSEWISGWDQIAKYLQKSVRTAKHYHYDLSMPVRKGAGGAIIIPTEVDECLKKLPTKLHENCTKTARKLHVQSPPQTLDKKTEK